MSYDALLYYPAAHPGNTWNVGQPDRSIGESGYESSWTSESFPLKKGMGCKTCASIKALQTELKKRGATSIKVIDGFFGNDTAKALSDLGLPAELDRAAYDSIIAGKTTEAVADVSSVKPGKKNWQDTLTSVLDFAKDFQKGKGAGDGAGPDPGTGGDGGGAAPEKSKTWIWVTAGVVVFLIIIIVLVVVLKKKKEGKAE